MKPQANKIKKSKKKIDFGWQSDDERIKRWMKIPAKKKMEWLQQMHEFTVKASSKRQKKLRQKLREML